MKINSIHLENWMPFKGKQEVIFPTDNHSNILIINGENNHGKTSLITAFRWCLYGVADSNNSRSIPEHELLNSEAAKEGDKHLTVVLKFEADDNKYELTRSISFDSIPHKSSVFLKENNQNIAGSNIKNKIEFLIPEQISQFFLFDGELLQEFQQLVIEESGTQSKKIKASIEKALGIPIIQRAIEELSKKNKILQKQKQAKLAQNVQIQRMVRELEDHTNDLEIKENEIYEINKIIQITHEKVIEFGKKLENQRKDIELITKKKTIEKEKIENLNYITEKKLELQKFNSDLWKIPLFKSVENNKKNLTEELDKLREAEKDSIGANTKLASLLKAIRNKKCDTCGHQLTDEQEEEINQEINKLESFLSVFEENQEKVKELYSRISKIQLQNPSDHSSAIKIINEEINKRGKRNIQIENELFDINKILDQYDYENASIIKSEYDINKEEEGRLKGKLEICENDIEMIKERIEQIKNNPDYKKASSNSGISTLPEFAENIEKIFKTASEKYRDSMKNAIQVRATETFGKLTTENKFDRLDINSSYGLSLIVDNEAVTKGKGAEQIVALSLMDAINYLGRRKGPMIMDTPMGRLDNSHRKNIMHHLPDASTQLAVFVHSGEISKQDRDIYFDKSRIGKIYKIVRKSTFHSQIEVDYDG